MKETEVSMKIALIGCAAFAVFVAVLIAAHTRKVCRTAMVFLDHY